MADENKIRKVIWARKEAVEAKMAEAGFEALRSWSSEAFGEGGYKLIPPEEEEEYRKRAEEMNRRIRPGMYADECKHVWNGEN